MRNQWLWALLLMGCSSLTGGADEVRVRVHNLSGVAFDSVTVQFPKDTHRYGRVGAGERSEYATVSEAYRYARIEAWVAGKSYVLQPIDFVGEHLLPPGDYTYGLTFSGAPAQLGIVMADQYAREHGVLFLVAEKPATTVMEALFQGRVVQDAAGCFRLESTAGATVIWPYGFRLDDGSVRDAKGRSLGRIGGQFRFGGGYVGTTAPGVLSDSDRSRAAARCPGEYWIVGDTD